MGWNKKGKNSLSHLNLSLFLFRGDKTPTIRSDFTFEQFRVALHDLAYKIALDAVQTMKHKDLVVKAHGSRLEYVETDEYLIKFYSKHASFGKRSRSQSWDFDVEEKFYIDSKGGCSKISFYSQEEDTAKTEKTIKEFIAELMVSQKPQPRFKLSQVTSPNQ